MLLCYKADRNILFLASMQNGAKYFSAIFLEYNRFFFLRSLFLFFVGWLFCCFYVFDVEKLYHVFLNTI